VDITPYPNLEDHDATTPPYPMAEKDKDSYILSHPLPGEKLPWRTETPAERMDEPTVILNEKQDSGSTQGSDIESSHVSGPDGSKMQVRDVTPSGVAANATNRPRLNNQLLAEEISSGHGFLKHAHENREFEGLGITTQEQYQSFVEDIVSNSATEVRYAANGKVFYLDRSTNTVVIKSPNGEATAFRPDFGINGIGWDDFLDQQVPGPSQSIKNNPSYDPINNGRTY
jgi:hypothetical protein